ncbi:AAA family ATPase [Kribbella sp. NPDC051952]|uniref:helix-turn-helix transcriptional regulator n=1 Tax=Kribbella sp. NPDC051952 TaxID=3154851 RepID=UPI00341536F1
MSSTDLGSGPRWTEPPFTGRERELADLVATVRRATEGPGGALILRGEAGIGKSRTLTAAARHLSGDRVHLLRVRARELERAIPYRAFRRALGRAFGGAAGDTAELTRALVHVLDGTAQQSVAAVHGASGRLFSALRTERPVLLLVDDLHLADDDTIVLLAGLSGLPAKHPLVVIATVRGPEATNCEPLVSWLERLRAERQLWQFDLGPLPDDELARLVEVVIGAPAASDVLDLVRTKSSGNPFFAIQTLLDLTEGDPAEGPDPTTWSTADDRRAAVLHRILRVAPDVRRLAAAIALLRSVQLDRLELAAELAGLSPAAAAAGCDDLLARGILRLDGAGGCQFGHELVRDALYQQIGPAEHWRWHTLAAQRLTELPESADRDLQIAVHVRETARPGDAHAIAVLARAAQAVGVAAPRSAIPWYQRAVELAGNDRQGAAALTAKLARAYLLAGRPEDAAGSGSEALAVLPPGESRTRLVPLVLEALIEQSALTEAVALVEAERVAGRWTVGLAAQASYVLAMAGRAADAGAATREVLAGLDSLPAVLRINALVHLVHTRCVMAGYGAVGELVGALRDAAVDAPVQAQLNAYSTISYVLAMQGDTAACAEAIAATDAVVPTSDWRLYQAELSVARAQHAANVGDWDVAVALAEAAMAELADTGSRSFLTVIRGLLLELRAGRGEWAAANRLVDGDAAASAALAALESGALSTLHLLAGDVAAARDCLQQQLARADDLLPRVRAMLHGRLAEVELEAGDLSAARAALDEHDRLDAGVPEYANAARILYARGRAAGDPELVRAGLALADEHRLALARGQGLLQLGAMDVEPEQNLTAAIRVFHDLGAAPWRRRAAAGLRDRGLKVPRNRATERALLTEAESQIARLVQLGRSNREIAVAVSLSVKTVEAYLSRVYTKTGCTGRFELARALDQGLLD